MLCPLTEQGLCDKRGCIWSWCRDFKREEFQAFLFLSCILIMKHMDLKGKYFYQRGKRYWENLSRTSEQFEFKWLAFAWVRRVSYTWVVICFCQQWCCLVLLHQCWQGFKITGEFFPADPSDGVCVSISFKGVMIGNHFINYSTANCFWKHYPFT